VTDGQKFGSGSGQRVYLDCEEAQY
jgi:hypothetical protein